MRTIARIAITFTGAVILTAEIATPSAHAGRGLTGGKDFWAMAYRGAALPRPQQGPGPGWLRQPFAAAIAVRVQPMPNVANLSLVDGWKENEHGEALVLRGEDILIESIAQRNWSTGATGSSLRGSAPG